MPVDLRLGDCLPILRSIQDKTFDLVLTDPPYGIKITNSIKEFGDCPDKSRKTDFTSWDNHIPGGEYFYEIMRVSKNQIIFGGNYFLSYLGPTPCFIVWDKRGVSQKFHLVL